jgi:hypothetical protein
MGGTAVTIAGTGFQSETTVSLGRTWATGVVVASGTSITATVEALRALVSTKCGDNSFP